MLELLYQGLTAKCDMYSSLLTLYSIVGDAIPKFTVLCDADNESSPHWNREIRTVRARGVYGDWSSPCLKDMGRKTRSSTGYLGLWKYDESRNAEGSGEGGPASRALIIAHDEIQIHCLDTENGKRNIILNMWRRVTRMGRRQAGLGIVIYAAYPWRHWFRVGSAPGSLLTGVKPGKTWGKHVLPQR